MFSKLLIALLATSVHGHGYIKSVILNSKTYTGYLPVATPNFAADAPSIHRKVNADNPVFDVYSPDITCHKGAVPIPGRAGIVKAGGTIVYQWNEWSHLSPLLTYMARCANDNCGTFTGREGPVWFKIQEDLFTNGSWATQKMMLAGFKWNVVVPKCLAPGQYLVRHEALNIAGAHQALGKCQFFMSCLQVKVEGSGKVVPTDLVSFPGAYNPTDPGIFWNTYTGNRSEYPAPGPRPFVCPS